MKSKNWANKRGYDGQNKHSNYEYSKSQATNSNSAPYSQYSPRFYPSQQMYNNAYSSPPPMWPIRPPISSHMGQQLYPHSNYGNPARSSTPTNFSPLDTSNTGQRIAPLSHENFSQGYTTPSSQKFPAYQSNRTNSGNHANQSKSSFSYPSQSHSEPYSNDSFETNTFHGSKTKPTPQSLKKKKPVAENTTLKEWRRKDALQAVALEERFSKRNSNPPTLILRFPDPELDRDIVKGFSPNIEGVHFQQNYASRYCFVRLKKDADVEKTIEELSSVPFGTGFISAELRKVVTNQPSSTNIERVDPYSLYIGNLPRNVSVANVKETFPGAQRYDVAYSQKTWPSQYAFVRYRTVADALRAFTQSVNKTIESRSLVIRFRRVKSNFTQEEPLSKDDIAIINEVIDAEPDELDEVLQFKSSSAVSTTSSVANSASNSSSTSKYTIASGISIKQEPIDEDDLSNAWMFPMPVKEEDNGIEHKLFEGESRIKSEIPDDMYDDDFMYESDEDFDIGNNRIRRGISTRRNTERSTNERHYPKQNNLAPLDPTGAIKTEEEPNRVNVSRNCTPVSTLRPAVYENSFVTSVVNRISAVKREDVDVSCAVDAPRESNSMLCNRNFISAPTVESSAKRVRLDGHDKDANISEDIKKAIKEEKMD